MPAVGKEIERQVTSEVGSAPFESVGYVEKIEKQTEIQKTTSTTQQDVPEIKEQLEDMGKIVSKQFAVQTKPSIVLPMGKQELTEGLHRGVFDSVRWLAEWCVMMIKKYPGRVFYLPPEKI